MAYPHQELWNHGLGIASHSVVLVRSAKIVSGGKRKAIDPMEFNFCEGFIVETEEVRSFVAVHESHINLSDAFYISLGGGEPRPATVFLKRTASQYVILVVSLEDPMSRKIRAKKMVVRGDIAMLSVHGTELLPFYSSVINPSTQAINSVNWRTIVDGSENWFTFGCCDDDVNTIMGAPLFDRDGYFIGVVCADESTLPEYEHVPKGDRCLKLKYARHALSFLPNLRKEIKAKLEPKGNKARNSRRR